MKKTFLALVLALSVVSWAQDVTPAAPSTPNASTEAKSCPCCDKAASADAKGCCEHHAMSANDSKEPACCAGKKKASCCKGSEKASCCNGTDAQSCSQMGDKMAANCCKDACKKDGKKDCCGKMDGEKAANCGADHCAHHTTAQAAGK